MKHVCRRSITAVCSGQVLSDHIERCIKQKPAKTGFSWNDKIMFEDHHMKISLPYRVCADFECIFQPQKDPNQFKYYLNKFQSQ